MPSLTQVAKRIFGAPYDPPEHLWLAVLFSPSEAAQAAGKEFLKRKHLRQEGRDPEVNDKVSPAQVEAMDKWGVQKKEAYDYLKTIKLPTGSHGKIMPISAPLSAAAFTRAMASSSPSKLRSGRNRSAR
jgi:hypothetical protein